MTTQAVPLNKILERGKRQTLLISKRLLQHAWRTRHRYGNRQVVFVAGVQRSGTNMMMNVFDRSFDTEVYHERDPRAFDHYEMRPRKVIRNLIDSSPASHVIIKALCELQDLDALLRDFAPARAVWMLRDFDDVVNSHLRLWSGMPETIRLIVNDGSSAGWRGSGMSEETRVVLREHYYPDISNASACALFWYFRNVLFFERQLNQNPDVKLVRYEELVTHPHEAFQMIFNFLNLRYTPGVSRYVRASSVRKSTPAAIDPDIRRLCERLHGRFLETMNLPDQGVVDS